MRAAEGGRPRVVLPPSLSYFLKILKPTKTFSSSIFLKNLISLEFIVSKNASQLKFKTLFKFVALNDALLQKEVIMEKIHGIAGYFVTALIIITHF